MAYHPLTNETGGNAFDAKIEAKKILEIINEYADVDEMTTKEQDFLEQMEDAENVSPRQLLWLRDIKDKYI